MANNDKVWVIGTLIVCFLWTIWFISTIYGPSLLEWWKFTSSDVAWVCPNCHMCEGTWKGHKTHNLRCGQNAHVHVDQPEEEMVERWSDERRHPPRWDREDDPKGQK